MLQNIYRGRLAKSAAGWKDDFHLCDNLRKTKNLCVYVPDYVCMCVCIFLHLSLLMYVIWKSKSQKLNNFCTWPVTRLFSDPNTGKLPAGNLCLTQDNRSQPPHPIKSLLMEVRPLLMKIEVPKERSDSVCDRISVCAVQWGFPPHPTCHTQL